MRRGLLLAVWLLVLQVAAGPSAGSAQEQGPSGRAAQVQVGEPTRAEDDGSLGFRAVRGATGESVPGGRLLAIGYGAFWVLVFGFVLRCVRSQMATRRKLVELERAMGLKSEG